MVLGGEILFDVDLLAFLTGRLERRRRFRSLRELGIYRVKIIIPSCDRRRQVLSI